MAAATASAQPKLPTPPPQPITMRDEPPAALVAGAKSFSLSPGPGNPWPLFSATVRNILAAKKTIALMLLMLAPVVITFLVAASSRRGLRDYGIFLQDEGLVPLDHTGGLMWFFDGNYGLYYTILLPLVIAIFAASTLREEIEGKTLPYLFTRPIYRNWVVLPKSLGIMAGTFAMSVVATTVFWFVAVSMTENPFRHIGQLFGFWGLNALIVFAATGLFTLIGTLMRRGAILIGIYLFVWEAGLSNIPIGFIRRTSLIYYERTLMHSISSHGYSEFERVTDLSPSSGIAIAVLLFVGLFGMLGALYVVSNKDYNV